MKVFTLYLTKEMREHFNRLEPYVAEIYVAHFIVELIRSFSPDIPEANRQCIRDYVREMAYNYYEEEATYAEEDGAMETIRMDCFFEAVDVAYEIAAMLVKHYDIFDVFTPREINDVSFSLTHYDEHCGMIVIEAE